MPSPTAPADPSHPHPPKARGFAVAAAALGVVALILVGRTLPLGDWIAASRERVDALGALGPVLFGVVYVAAALLFVPGSVITLAAGSLFGTALGTLTVSVASTVAAALAFLLARGALRQRVERWAAGSPRFRALDAAIAREGWRVVGLLRLSPVMPFSLGNYLFGLTRVRFRPYVLVSWLAMLPGTALYVSLGAAGAEAVAGMPDGSRGPRAVLLGVGIVATLAVTVLLARAARRRLDSAEISDAPHTP